MALITAAEARAQIPGLTGTGDDSAISVLIDRVDRVFARWCGYPSASAGGNASMEDASYVLYNGPGGHVDVLDSRRIQLRVWPVTAVTSIYDDTTEAYGTAVTASYYAITNGDAGIVEYTMASGQAWRDCTAGHNLKVTATCGWVTIPDDLKQAAMMMVRHWRDLRHVQTKTNASAGSSSASVRDETIPAAVREILQPFRLPSVYL